MGWKFEGQEVNGPVRFQGPLALSSLSFEKSLATLRSVKFTAYFQAMRQRPDRAVIRLERIERVIEQPEKELVQEDGRVLRVILLPDRETVHNAFFDRSVRL